jgi:hypothetical protein
VYNQLISASIYHFCQFYMQYYLALGMNLKDNWIEFNAADLDATIQADHRRNSPSVCRIGI